MSRAGSLQTWCLESRFTRPENLVSQSLWVLYVLFCKFHVCFHVSSLRRGLSLATPPLSTDWWSVAVMFSYLHNLQNENLHRSVLYGSVTILWSWSSTRVTIGFLITTLIKALLPSVAQFTWETSSWKSPGCFKLFPLRVTETTCFCDPSMQQSFFLNSSPDVWLDASLFLSSRQFFFFLPQGLVFALKCIISLLDLFFKMCVPFQIIPIQLNLPNVNFTQSVVTSMLLS